MREENKIDKAIRLLKAHYYVNIIFLASLFLLFLFRLLPFFHEKKTISVTLETFTLIISIVAVPGALKYFAIGMKKIHSPLEACAAIKKYKWLSFTRIYILSIAALTNIILYGYSGNMNFFWFTVVFFITFLFCRPSYPELAALTEVKGEKNEPLQDVKTIPGNEDIPRE